jgi:hypothetical protein
MLRLEVFMAAIMKNGVVWNVTPCGFCKNRHFGEKYRLHHQSGKNWYARKNVSNNQQLKHCLQLLGIANIVPSALIFHSVKVEARCSSETSVLTSATRRHIPEYGILHSHRREDFKYYVVFNEVRKRNYHKKGMTVIAIRHIFAGRRVNCSLES